MEDKFVSGLFLGIVIGVVGMKIVIPTPQQNTTSNNQVIRPIVVPHYNFYSDDFEGEFDYAAHGLHVR